MKRLQPAFLLGILIAWGSSAMAVEEAKYTVVEKDGSFEIRDYAPYVLAEVTVKAGLEDAGNIAFNRLFGYITGKNRTRAKIAMTAPVSQEPASRKIAMTAPVSQEPATGGGWSVSFTMPASCTMENLPTPEDAGVTLRPVPARRMAAVRYSGRWTEKGYLLHKAELTVWIAKKGLAVAGDAVWARYNPPFTPWFLRRNEILIPISGG